MWLCPVVPSPVGTALLLSLGGESMHMGRKSCLCMPMMPGVTDVTATMTYVKHTWIVASTCSLAQVLVHLERVLRRHLLAIHMSIEVVRCLWTVTTSAATGPV